MLNIQLTPTFLPVDYVTDRVIQHYAAHFVDAGVVTSVVLDNAGEVVGQATQQHVQVFLVGDVNRVAQSATVMT